MTASKKGISAHQVHRMLGISYKSTWLLMHRLHDAMPVGDFSPMGGEGQIVEADETYFGKLYLAKFDFRYNNRIALGVDDGARAEELAKAHAASV